MKVSSHGDQLVKLTRLGAVNCYLVREPDGLTLIDTMIPGSADAIIRAAEQAGGAIARIALTHAHQDHVGSLDALHEKLPGAEIAVPAREVLFMHGDTSLDPEEERKGKLRGGFPKVGAQPTRELRAGDRVGSLEVVPAPGHTPGHVAFFDTRDRALVAGDAFQTLGGVAVCGTIRPLFPLVAMGTWHKATAVDSARRLHGLEPSLLAVGHGRVLESPAGAMEQAIAAAGG